MSAGKILLIIGSAGLLVVIGFLAYLGKQERIRIVRGGALMALDTEGLKRLNELYSIPKACTEENMASSTDPLRFQVCFPSPKPAQAEANKNGIVVIPDGTEAEFNGSGFVLPGGRIVFPYPANTYDMARDGAVEVEKIRITKPPNQGLEGWIEIHSLRRVCCGL